MSGFVEEEYDPKKHMRLSMKNVKCHEDRTFIFPAGMNLISAESGAGKSTIFDGVNYVLFGKPEKGIVTIGKESCEVTLEDDDITIFRRKKPKTLKVTFEGKHYGEKDGAQQIINQKYGRRFDITCYIAQNAFNSFVMMGPTEKNSFLRDLIFSDQNIDEMINKSKECYNERKKILDTNKIQLEYALKHLVDKPTEVENPFGTIKKSTESLKKYLTNEITRLQNCKIRIKNASNRQKKLQHELNDVNVYETNLFNHQTTRTKLCDKNTKLFEIIKMNDFIGDVELSKLQNELLHIINNREIFGLKEKYTTDVQRLETMKKEEITNITSKIDSLNNLIWKEYNKDESDKNIDITNKYLVDSTQLRKLTKELKKYECVQDTKKLADHIDLLNQNLILYTKQLEDFHLQKQLKKQICPSCHCKLRCVNESCTSLHTEVVDSSCTEETLRSQIEQTQKDIKISTKTLHDAESKTKLKNELVEEIDMIVSKYDTSIDIYNTDLIQKKYNSLIEYHRTQLMNEKKIEEFTSDLNDKLKGTNFSSSYNSYEKDIKKLCKKIQDMEKIMTKQERSITTRSEDQLRLLIENEQKKRDQLNNYKTNINENEREIDIVDSTIKSLQDIHLKTYRVIHDKEYLEKMIEIEEQAKNTQEIEIITLEKSIQSIQNYQTYKKHLDEYNACQENINKLKQDELINSEKFRAACLFKDKLKTAESNALQSILSSINEHAEVYLESFFPTHPISCILSPIKENKDGSTKAEINMDISYKGMTCDRSSLSGGELARVITAFALSLAEIFNSNILLLDESTASLDETSTLTVFEGIKEHYKGKTILIIAHQVVEGMFDNVIKL